jgi:hypothetical protein
MTDDVTDDTAPTSALIISFATVGAGLIAVATLLYGLIMAQTAPSEGHIVAVAGLVAYLAVWAWGLYLAQAPQSS